MTEAYDPKKKTSGYTDEYILENTRMGVLPLSADCTCEVCKRARFLQDELDAGRITLPAETTLDVGRFDIQVQPAFATQKSSVPNASLAEQTVEVRLDDANPKDILGASKPSMGLIPVGAMESVARVMELGAKKYGPYNWRSKKVKAMVYANAGLRHLFKWIGGESIDEESGQPHLAHCAACMLIVLDAMATGNLIDDRTWPKKN